MNTELQNHLSLLIDSPIQNIFPVSGGDISLAYKVQTKANAYFLKVNRSKDALTMFQKEKRGLETIALTQTISTPKVYACDTFKSEAFVLMEYIENKRPNANDFIRFGKELAALHQITSENFGFQEDNFIGSLPQSNTQKISWLDFYIIERLVPQLELAKQKGLLSKNEYPSEKTLNEKLENFFINVKPSLLHGDLWSGNYLISKNGTPYLIDPAVYYGHNEVDIAMSKLFGGFGDDFYDTYFSIFPKEIHTSSRIEIYQLYYLLVHLNLFGESYYSSVLNLLKRHIL